MFQLDSTGSLQLHSSYDVQRRLRVALTVIVEKYSERHDQTADHNRTLIEIFVFASSRGAISSVKVITARLVAAERREWKGRLDSLGSDMRDTALHHLPYFRVRH